MPLLSFAEFQTAAVASGVKRRTIRPETARVRVGSPIRLTGPRPRFKPLGEAVCANVRPCVLVTSPAGDLMDAFVGGDRVPYLEAFARLDGFASARAMGEFFCKLRGPGEFRGVLIEW